MAVFWQWNVSIHAFNVSPRSERAAHLSGPPAPALKASSHNERIFVNKIYGHWTLPYRVLPHGARERSSRLARLFSLETRLKSVVSAESFCLGLDCVPRFSAAVSPFYHLSFCLSVAAAHYNTTNLIISAIWLSIFLGIHLTLMFGLTKIKSHSFNLVRRVYSKWSQNYLENCIIWRRLREIYYIHLVFIMYRIFTTVLQ